jgi:PHD/YefM family antitoxin component YafN of YafNO toxin-antitoxin module
VRWVLAGPAQSGHKMKESKTLPILKHCTFGELKILAAFESGNSSPMFLTENGTKRQVLADPQYWESDCDPLGLWEKLFPESVKELKKKMKRDEAAAKLLREGESETNESDDSDLCSTERKHPHLVLDEA